MRLGFTLFSSSGSGSPIGAASDSVGTDEDVAFVPLAMPIMFGPGAIATILGMTSLVKQSEFEVAAFAEISAAIVTTMSVTYLVLRAAKLVLSRIGPRGIDAATRIVGFFVSAMGMGLVFHGTIEAFQSYGLMVSR
jgi:multiple antibiotic resistance protein